MSLSYCETESSPYFIWQPSFVTSWVHQLHLGWTQPAVVPLAVSGKAQILWDATLCHWVSSSRRFEWPAQLLASHHRRLEYLLHHSGQPVTGAILSEINPVYYFFHVTYFLILSSERRIGLRGGLLPSDSPATFQLAIRDTLSHSLYTADAAATDCEVWTLARCDPNHSNYWPSLDCQSADTYSAVQTASRQPHTQTPACVAVSAMGFFSVTCDSFIPRLVYSFDNPFKH